jgi:hypothetical protein
MSTFFLVKVVLLSVSANVEVYLAPKIVAQQIIEQLF